MALLRKTLLLTALLLSAGCGFAAETVEDVIALAHKGISEQEMLKAVVSNEEGFTLTLDRANECRKSGVPETVVLAMLRNPASARSGSFMHLEIARIFGVKLTGWKLVGFLGVFLFTGRWLVQLYASRKAGRPVMGRAFWLLSMLGSTLLLTYFVVGKNDSVGVLSNLFPCFVAAYNLYLDIRYHRANGVRAEDVPPARKVPARQKAEASGVEVAAGQ